MRIISVTGYKGGVGKSTTAIHIATYLSNFGKTLLVDGDPNRTALSWAARGELPFRVSDLVSCSTSQQQAQSIFQGQDYVVIDTPARPDSDDLEELANGSSLMILPTTPDIVSLDPMLQTLKDLHRAPCRALLTIVPPKPNREGELLRANLKAHGVPVFDSLIRRSVGFPKAALAGVPLRDLTGRDRTAWLDYQALGEEIMTYLRHLDRVRPTPMVPVEDPIRLRHKVAARTVRPEHVAPPQRAPQRVPQRVPQRTPQRATTIAPLPSPGIPAARRVAPPIKRHTRPAPPRLRHDRPRPLVHHSAAS
ncbi:MAG: AAA family ATPase [Cyanobacteria bacterium J06632_22]